MSTKKSTARKTPVRRGRNRRMWLLPDEDIPLSLLTSLLSPRTPKTKRKPTPRKRTARAVALPATVVAPEIVNLDDTPENIDMLNNVDSKLDNFMATGNFISSDEDETEMIRAKINKKQSPNPFLISDDYSDDDLFKPNFSKFDFSKPSTSAGPSKNFSKDLEPLNDDIIDIVDSVLGEKTDEPTPLKDMKSLEEYRKETEEMLKNASSLLDEFKTGRKIEPEEEKREPSPSKVTVGSCPVCLEPLSSRPAMVTVCGHIFCKECITQTTKTLKKCPTCRSGITMKKIHPIYF